MERLSEEGDWQTQNPSLSTPPFHLHRLTSAAKRSSVSCMLLFGICWGIYPIDLRSVMPTPLQTSDHHGSHQH